MKDVYLMAAELADNSFGIPSCSCIKLRSGTDTEASKYSSLFKPTVGTKNNSAWGLQWSDDVAERKQCRVLALLFMHWITESEK